MKVIVLQRQSIADIAIQVYGDIRGALEIAIANNMSVTTVLEAGTEIDCPDTTFSPYIQEYVEDIITIRDEELIVCFLDMIEAMHAQ